VGSITGDAPRELTIPLAFLDAGKKYVAHIYENGKGKTDVVISTRPVDAGTVLKVALPAAGGHAMRIAPQ
jgi:alpha-glucosidase